MQRFKSVEIAFGGNACSKHFDVTQDHIGNPIVFLKLFESIADELNLVPPPKRAKRKESSDFQAYSSRLVSPSSATRTSSPQSYSQHHFSSISPSYELIVTPLSPNFDSNDSAYSSNSLPSSPSLPKTAKSPPRKGNRHRSRIVSQELSARVDQLPKLWGQLRPS